MDLTPAVLISAIAACISALSALVATWNYHRERLNQKMTAAKWKKEYFADLLKWSDENMLLLSEAMHLCELDPKRMADNKPGSGRGNGIAPVTSPTPPVMRFSATAVESNSLCC